MSYFDEFKGDCCYAQCVVEGKLTNIEGKIVKDANENYIIALNTDMSLTNFSERFLIWDKSKYKIRTRSIPAQTSGDKRQFDNVSLELVGECQPGEHFADIFAKKAEIGGRCELIIRLSEDEGDVVAVQGNISETGSDVYQIIFDKHSANAAIGKSHLSWNDLNYDIKKRTISSSSSGDKIIYSNVVLEEI